MKIAFVHPDAEGREEEIQQKLYPKNQLWGADLLQDAGHEVHPIQTKVQTFSSKLGHWLNKLTGQRLADFHIEFQVFSKAGDADMVYAPSGHFLLLPLLRRLGLFRPKLVTWFFRLPESKAWWTPRNLRFSRYVLNGFDGLLCLTQKTASDFRERTNDVPVESIPWYADPSIFVPEEGKGSGDYFLAVGKTRRDYPTLLEACARVDAKFRIIAPKEVSKGVEIPENVLFIETSSDPPDAAISYPELREWYAGAKAVLIPLSGDPDDTSGYTSLLEAIQMGKPIIMTRSGCLDVDLERWGIGQYVPPQDSQAWVEALEGWIKGSWCASYLDSDTSPSRIFSSENFLFRLNRSLSNISGDKLI